MLHEQLTLHIDIRIKFLTSFTFMLIPTAYTDSSNGIWAHS